MFNCSLPDFPNLSSARFSQREASLCFPSTSSLNSEGGGKLRPSFSIDSLPEGFPYQNSLTDEAWELIQFVAARYSPSLLFLSPFPPSFPSLLFLPAFLAPTHTIRPSLPGTLIVLPGRLQTFPTVSIQVEKCQTWPVWLGGL